MLCMREVWDAYHPSGCCSIHGEMYNSYKSHCLASIIHQVFIGYLGYLHTWRNLFGKTYIPLWIPLYATRTTGMHWSLSIRLSEHTFDSSVFGETQSEKCILPYVLLKKSKEDHSSRFCFLWNFGFKGPDPEAIVRYYSLSRSCLSRNPVRITLHILLLL
jgi:hypothetical protein